MINQAFCGELREYVESLCPIVFLQTFDFQFVDEQISSLADNAKIIEWNNALGEINFKYKGAVSSVKRDLLDFLNDVYDSASDPAFNHDSFVILKDISKHFERPEVVASIRRIVEAHLTKKDFSATIFIVDSQIRIPESLSEYVTVIDIPDPDDDEVRAIIEELDRETPFVMPDELRPMFTEALRGFSRFEIKQTLSLVFHDGGECRPEEIEKVRAAKKKFLKKSSLLQLVDRSEKLENIGGLAELIGWLKERAQVFGKLDETAKFGIDTPRGLMLVGMPGCGKSLTAKVTARLFDISLLSLDIGRLLGKYVGDSEENMRKALVLAEQMAPCVLWIDEIEKAFAGVNGGGDSGVTTRLFGQFLTWMQENKSPVFVVATANSLDNIPPEFLRKGRFDEIFSVDLPDLEERRVILQIHFQKRGRLNDDLDLEALAKATDGFSGADLETVVKESILKAYLTGAEEVSNEIALEIAKETKSISETMKDRIDQIREGVKKMSLKPASGAKETK